MNKDKQLNNTSAGKSSDQAGLFGVVPRPTDEAPKVTVLGVDTLGVDALFERVLREAVKQQSALVAMAKYKQAKGSGLFTSATEGDWPAEAFNHLVQGLVSCQEQRLQTVGAQSLHSQTNPGDV